MLFNGNKNVMSCTIYRGWRWLSDRGWRWLSDRGWRWLSDIGWRWLSEIGGWA